MSAAHLHLIVVHSPIFAVGFGLLLIFWGLIRKSRDLQNAAIAFFIIAAITVVISTVSGELAEDAAASFPSLFADQVIEHEEAGEWAQVSVLTLATSAIFLLIVRKYKPLFEKAAVALTVLLSFVSLVLLIQTANLGGQLRHIEIRQSE